MNNKKTIIVALIVVVIVGVFGFFIYDKVQSQNRTAIAYKNLDTAMASQIKASIDLYYVLNGRYPLSSSSLIEGLPKNNKENKEAAEVLQKSIKNLKDFNYSVRGDDQAYKFTYTDAEGNEQSVEGNYKEDFH